MVRTPLMNKKILSVMEKITFQSNLVWLVFLKINSLLLLIMGNIFYG
ncbi:hypothetical protein MED92_02963 [Oceanospirillum sp. MED92]|uniref:Uncharacterized protein n=1 Tax=Neptuniibacter caesariensis TaxID=207954 RepID=A0A7U8C5X5_NEPCE|nr:hypothetical protein MED92_02963 [Oceanospirillum sp. MED92] [Neptuniibacter caesariensis]